MTDNTAGGIVSGRRPGAAGNAGDRGAVNAASPLFDGLQARLAEQYRTVFSNPKAPRTVIILPSLTFDGEILQKVDGAIHYEQRLLCLLFLLRFPSCRVVYLTSEPIPEPIIDYYLHLLPAIPHDHARRRLTLISCHDSTPGSLTDKVLARPRLMERIRAAIPDPASAHITCFNVTSQERALALALDLPIYGTDPSLERLGTKSGSRALFKAAGVPTPDGEENLSDLTDVAEALCAIKRRDPALRKAVVKLNDGFSGEGNAVFDFAGAPENSNLRPFIDAQMPKMSLVAKALGYEAYAQKFAEMGGIVEAFVSGEDKRLPSVQYRVDPLGQLEIVSTHDQVTGGTAGHVFEGCRFPADAAYRMAIQAAAQPAAEALRDKGALGRFAIDFISVRRGGAWQHYALEVNLRKGGTTHPFLMLQHLTDGRYDPASGLYRSLSGRELCYYASDNLTAPHYKGLTPDDLVDIAIDSDLHFHALKQEGVAFHLIGALSSFGKLGVTCVAGTMEDAEQLYRNTVAALDKATKPSSA